MIDGNRLKLNHYQLSEEDLGDHNSLQWGAFDHDPRGNFVIPEYMSFSDYSGSLVERSNVEEFIEEFGDYQGKEWWELYGGHGTRGIVVRVDADERVPEIGEFFEGLANYPLANEDRHSELEMQQRQEDWDSYGRHDFQRWLAAAREQRDKQGISLVLVPFVRGTLAEKYPGFDPAFDRFEDSVILELVGGTDPWETFVGELSSEALDSLWGELMHAGSGAAEEIEQHSTVFRYESAFNDFYEDGQKGAGIAEVLRFTEKADGKVEEWNDFEAWVLSLEKNGIGPEHKVRSVVDYLLENGGVWDEKAEHLLRSQKLGRYA